MSRLVQRRTWWSWCVVGLIAAAVQGAEPIEIVIGPQATALERFAADELAGQLQRLLKRPAQVSTDLSGAGRKIFLGTPQTNPEVQQRIGSQWPRLSDQGMLIRSAGQGEAAGLVIGGGSDRATLWAVYEFAHRLGLRTLLQGDFLPVQRPEIDWSGWNLLVEPTAKVRAWQIMDGGPTGWEAWGQADYQRLLRQLARQKVNRIVLAWEPDQPFVKWEAAGAETHQPLIFNGHEFPVGGDTAGRKAFRGVTRFENPHFAGLKTDPERFRVAAELAQAVLAEARRLGMTTALRLAPGRLPRGTEGNATSQNATAQRARESQLLRACLEQYPTIDALYLDLPAESAQATAAVAAWSETCKSVRPSDRAPLELQFVATPAVATQLAVAIAGSGAGVVERLWADNRSQDATRPSTNLRRQRLVELTDPAAEALPQIRLQGLDAVPESLAADDVDGWLISCHVPSDAELASYFFARSAVDPQATPAATCEELITSIAGPGVAERLLKGFGQVEQAVALIRKNAPEFATVKPEMVLQHLQPAESPPAWWGEVRTLYTEAMNEMYRGNTRARDGGRSFILYFARRYEFGLTYLSGLESLRQSAVARQQDESEERLQHLEGAVESFYNALGAFSEVARDPSDRGAIAVLNAFAYRPLMRELEAASEE